MPKREAADDAPTGIVARRQRARIGIAFDESPPDRATEGRVAIELLPSSATYDRLSGAVRRMRDARRWHPVLRGEPPPFEARPPEAPRVQHRLNTGQEGALAQTGRAHDLRPGQGQPGH